ncbi:GIN domain-containing protein [Hyunsoonleella pacifica]|uniref:DUF2807 domain-containing protein n=1 Tax=Hyunsoonleella pacifica TaxID=1080224 RepID=A0A4V2JAK6_9FLAO|nr:DUF2807 domain-containing protein [Hyunsoonleella pacifica]TBN13046.1 DUF2807 domain-containing protein [Hyunsoonleella pacifica]GGD27617.1 hypothetical protein GCM10011368_32020 [Hyunsoonleella pacifica]
MKRYFLAIILVSVAFTKTYTQNIEKIKGNRIVTIINTEIDGFHTIALDEDFEIDLIYNKVPSVEIETDENLHEVIDFMVRDSVLYFNKLKRITSKKRLRIKVSYDDLLQHIEVTDDAEIHGLTPLHLYNATLKTSGYSKVGLTIKTDNFNFESIDKAKVKLNVTADTCLINMRGSGKLEALINAPKVNASIYERTNAIIEGNCDNADLELDNNAQFNGKNFTINTCRIVCNISSSAYLEVMKDISIDATGTSSIYLYQNPKIVINSMTDTTKLQKKVK